MKTNIKPITLAELGDHLRSDAFPGQEISDVKVISVPAPGTCIVEYTALPIGLSGSPRAEVRVTLVRRTDRGIRSPWDMIVCSDADND